MKTDGSDWSFANGRHVEGVAEIEPNCADLRDQDAGCLVTSGEDTQLLCNCFSLRRGSFHYSDFPLSSFEPHPTTGFLF